MSAVANSHLSSLALSDPFRDLSRPKGQKGVRAELLQPFPDNLPKDLPIREVLDQVVESVNKFPFTILSGPTGCGKTLGVTLKLLQEQFAVVVTQPRILAAQSNSTFLANSIGEEVGQRIGYRTGSERKDSVNTVGQFVTDGLEVMRMLNHPTRASLGHKKVLILDEFHERNLNMDALLADLVGLYRKGSLSMPIVIMSATLDLERLQSFLEKAPLHKKSEAPPQVSNIITCSGRRFKIEHRTPDCSAVDNAVRCAKNNDGDVLFFVAGKREIHDRIDAIEKGLRSEEIDAVVLALHSDIGSAQRMAVMQDYGKPKIVVCTNIAEASVTVPGVRYVIDECLVRRIRTKDGIQGLYTEYISQSEMDQRAGRCGRMLDGVYYGYHPLEKEQRPSFPPPEILRLQLPNLVLRMLAHGRGDLRRITFLDNPPLSNLTAAEKSLRTLDCVDHSNAVTNLGQELAKVPVSVFLARMIEEGHRFGVLEQSLLLAALIESGGITEPGSVKQQLEETDLVFGQKNESSDALVQIDAFHWATSNDRSEAELDKAGISRQRLLDSQEQLNELSFRYQDKLRMQQGYPRDWRAQVQRAFVSGFKSHIFFKDRDGWREGLASSNRRHLGGDSVIKKVDYLVGVPFDLSLEPNGRTSHLVRWATSIPRLQVPKEILTAEKSRQNVPDSTIYSHRRSLAHRR